MGDFNIDLQHSIRSDSSRLNTNNTESNNSNKFMNILQSWTEVLSYIVVNKYKTTPSFTCDPFIVYNYVAK